jgi:hypothetical protein
MSLYSEHQNYTESSMKVKNYLEIVENYLEALIFHSFINVKLCDVISLSVT